MSKDNWGILPALTGVAVVGGVLVFAASALLPAYDRPPIESDQTGFRGTGMVDVVNPRERGALIATSEFPPAPMPLVTSGPKASEVYENVQVLGDLSQTQFTRLMLAITAWVSPEQGCTYCHADGEGFAADTLYTKRISRWMIQMTRHINNDWENHVGDTGVNCYTCHRGNNVPEYVWFEPRITGNQGLMGYYSELYGPSDYAGVSSLSQQTLVSYLEENDRIRVLGDTALPLRGGNRASTKQTEQTYALMMHMSESLGVNCTYCHNSRAFSQWDQSTPARYNAWFGIRMARQINQDYLIPVTETLPAYRLGYHNDVPKVNCTTCHQYLPKPLNGAPAVEEWPSLAAANVATREELLPGTLQPMWDPSEAAAAEGDEGTDVAATDAQDEQASDADATDAAVTVPSDDVTDAAPAQTDATAPEANDAPDEETAAVADGAPSPDEAAPTDAPAATADPGDGATTGGN